MEDPGPDIPFSTNVASVTGNLDHKETVGSRAIPSSTSLPDELPTAEVT